MRDVNMGLRAGDYLWGYGAANSNNSKSSSNGLTYNLKLNLKKLQFILVKHFASPYVTTVN